MLDKDTLTRAVVEAALEILGLSPHDRESEAYLKVVRPREYECAIAAALENVECGNSAIVAAPFIREFADLAWIHRTRAAFAEFGAKTTLVWVYCDADTMNMYLRHRGAARDAAKLADWPAYLSAINVDFRMDRTPSSTTPHRRFHFRLRPGTSSGPRWAERRSACWASSCTVHPRPERTRSRPRLQRSAHATSTSRGSRWAGERRRGIG
jgi:hypothetical protein